MQLIDQIDKTRLPSHVAIIMDGNGRWAKKKGKQRVFGHEQGVKTVKAIVEATASIEIPYLTLYAFSKENWNRPKYEVDALMHLLIHSLNNEFETLNKNNIRLHAIGDLDVLPGIAAREVKNAIKKTENNTGLNLIIAISYSAKWELTKAVKNIIDKVNNNELDIDTITDDTIADNLSTVGFPDPELLIRTSGEKRISNFLLWQIAYSELYFTDKLWPDFTKEDFYEAILDYQRRERRFGKTSEQLK